MKKKRSKFKGKNQIKFSVLLNKAIDFSNNKGRYQDSSFLENFYSIKKK